MTERNFELERQYEEMLATMSSDGWQLIMEDFERLRTVTADVRNCTNLEFNKGQVDILDLLMGWRDAVSKAYDQLRAEVEAPQPETEPGVAEVL